MRMNYLVILGMMVVIGYTGLVKVNQPPANSPTNTANLTSAQANTTAKITKSGNFLLPSYPIKEINYVIVKSPTKM